MRKYVAVLAVNKVLQLVLLSAVLLAQPAWAGECACTPCDFDADGDVDLADFGHLQRCLTGTGIVQSDPACLDARVAGHTYVDQQDIALFRACLGGAQQPYPGTLLPPAAISEFMASNDSGLADEDGDHPDWIEVYNPCQVSLNLDGWFLADDSANLQKWRFPAVTLLRGEFVVVFASGKDRRDPSQPLHANFQLDKGGEYLALVGPDGQTVVHAYTPQFPEQMTNVSYGLAQVSIKPVTKQAQAWYRIPTSADAGLGTGWTEPDFPDGSWAAGPTGLGFSSTPTNFQVTVYKANVDVPNLATAEAVIADPTKQSWSTTAQMSTINLWNSDLTGHFGGDVAFPGLNLTTDTDNFVTLVTGTVVIPTAGEWTFGVNSDDGFSLTLTQGTRVFTSSYPDLRGGADTMGIFNITSPGLYSLRLVQFEQFGGSSLELFAAQGYYETFDSVVFRLVGDVTGGGVALGGVGWDILTNLGSVMRNVNGSAWIRIPFDLDDATPYTGMKLRMQYVDGFAAYLNGQKIAERNAPANLAWNSVATAKRTGATASSTEEIDLAGFYTLLRSGRNVLAIHGLNDTAADGDFAIVPELVLSSSSMQPQYFPTPTPGAANVTGMLDFVRPVQFDQPHGFRSAAFQLAITCPTPGVQVYYTLDGSTPTTGSGLVYSGPITISGTSVVRAAAFKPNYLPSETLTATYLFVNDIIRQSPQGQTPGSGWPAGGYFGGQRIDYGMDPDIVNSTRYASLMDDALLAIPSISLVTDLPNLFSLTTGIYTHASGEGKAWERPCSVELINPNGGPGFQINAGVRIRGGFSRTGDNPKHAFRLFFRAEYGQGELNYPLFEAEGVSSFSHVDLRTGQNYSWSFGGDSRMTLSRDVFTRDLQGAMGDAYTRSRFYHLYIDGQYWGIYQTEERPEADYAASYFGGASDDYDVIKVEAGPYTIYATDGNTDAWYRLWQACQTGFSSDEAYYRVQGLNLDGARNSTYEVLVDVDNTIDCALVTYWGGDLDGPISNFLGNSSPNNFYVIRNRDGQSGFKCFKHDAEHTLLNVSEDRTGPWPAGGQFDQFNPQYLSQRLAGNAEYRMRFADRVQKHLFNRGVLAAENAAARFLARTNQIQVAIIAESARWGDAQTHPPLNRDDHWQPTVNWIVNTFIPQRNAVLLSQLQADNLYPSVSAPLFGSYGGQVPSGYTLTVSRPSGQSGTIYCTTDGSDPRVRGGGIASTAQSLGNGGSVVVNRNMTVKARIRVSATQWSALVEAAFVTQPVGLLINEFMADNKTTVQDPDEPGEYPDWIEIYNPNAVPVSMGGMYLTDDFNEPAKFQIASGVTIPASGYLVFWADNEPAQGSLHTNFALSKGGERIRVTAADGTTVVDQIIFSAQTTDVSYGRYPDGSATWGAMSTPTPNRTNNPLQ